MEHLDKLRLHFVLNEFLPLISYFASEKNQLPSEVLLDILRQKGYVVVSKEHLEKLLEVHKVNSNKNT